MDAAPIPPATLVIFGATGDLTRRLLIPAIINLTRSGLVGDDLNILGVGIDPGDDASLVARLDSFLSGLSEPILPETDDAWRRLRERISYISGDFTQDGIFLEIKKHLTSCNAASISPCRRSFSERSSKSWPNTA